MTFVSGPGINKAGHGVWGVQAVREEVLVLFADGPPESGAEGCSHLGGSVYK